MNEALIERLRISCLGLDAVDPLRLLVDDVISELESQEPVAWMSTYKNDSASDKFRFMQSDMYPTPVFTHPPQRTEPVDYEKLAALGWQAIECGICGGGAMGYPQRTWVGLTDEERGLCINANMGKGLWAMAKDVEAKLKEKNT